MREISRAKTFKDVRDPVFDWMRCVSITLIVLSHFLMFGGWGDSMFWLGRYLGDVFSIVFLCISALLYGLKWQGIRNQPFPIKSFMTKRFVKIAASLYPYLFLLLFFYVCYSVPFSIRKFVFNFAFLCWFDKIPTNGHLWFVTMIWICYGSLCVSSRIQEKGITRPLLLGMFLIGSIFMQLLLDKYNLPGYMFLLLFVYTLVFLYAFLKEVIYAQLDKRSSQSYSLCFIIFLLFLMFNTFTLYQMSMMEYDARHTTLWYLLTTCGLLWIVFLLILFHTFKQNRAVSFLSKISFELYLVHHILCCGTFSVIDTFDSPMANFLLLSIASIILAYLLHLISGKIQTFVIK